MVRGSVFCSWVPCFCNVIVMNSRMEMLFMVCCVISFVYANTNVAEFSNSTDLPVSNTTEIENSAPLVHFTKFNWTIVDGVDNSYGVVDEHESEGNKSRMGFERNLMVVLPVMQGNSDLSNSNLQMLYTKPPVTAIIGEEHQEERKPEQNVRTTIKIIEKSTTTEPPPTNELERIDREEDIRRDDIKSPVYTDFLTNLPASKAKSPLDYGYPETFKFIEDFNELPKNHRPEWASPEITTATLTKKSASFGVTKRDPFQMFESVKPLEINKLLSFKPIPVTDSISETFHKKKNQFLELSTELPLRPISKRPNKRPSKKPQKNKTTTVKYAPQSLDTVTVSTVSSPSVEKIYPISYYTTPSVKTSSIFLPTPWKEVYENAVETTRLNTVEPPTTSTKTTTTTTAVPPPITKEETLSTTTTTTTLATSPTTTPSTTAVSVTTTAATTVITTTPMTTTLVTSTTTSPPSSTTECKTEQKKHQIKSSDLINLKKILDEEFGAWPKPTTEAIKIQETTNSPYSSDLLTNDMRNMLLALGLLKADEQIKEQTTTTVANNYLEELFKKREPTAPTIDPNSYVSFKKIPIDFERQHTRLPVSDDMKDLLASFGLLPRGMNRLRMSRKRKFVGNEPSDTTDTENLENLTPLPFNYKPHEKGHVFHPTVHLETLGDPKKVRQINEVIDTIKKLSKNEQNTSVEEIEGQLERITSLINDESNSNNPFIGEVNEMINRTKIKMKQLNNKTDDLTNSDINYKTDESNIVKTYAKNLTELNLVMNPPNPLSSEELQQLLESNKNEVKRQQPSNETKIESGNAPLSELAASFGGGDTASETPVADDRPTAKPNGLYFWVDWNTFLNVGDSEKNTIKVKFNPRAGNPRNFLPITVP